MNHWKPIAIVRIDGGRMSLVDPLFADEPEVLREAFTSCGSCGGDISAGPVKRKLFAQFLMKVTRCPHCRLRTTFLTIRKSGQVILEKW